MSRRGCERGEACLGDVGEASGEGEGEFLGEDLCSQAKVKNSLLSIWLLVYGNKNGHIWD